MSTNLTESDHNNKERENDAIPMTQEVHEVSSNTDNLPVPPTKKKTKKKKKKKQSTKTSKKSRANKEEEGEKEEEFIDDIPEQSHQKHQQQYIPTANAVVINDQEILGRYGPGHYPQPRAGSATSNSLSNHRSNSAFSESSPMQKHHQMKSISAFVEGIDSSSVTWTTAASTEPDSRNQDYLQTKKKKQCPDDDPLLVPKQTSHTHIDDDSSGSDDSDGISIPPGSDDRIGRFMFSMDGSNKEKAHGTPIWCKGYYKWAILATVVLAIIIIAVVAVKVSDNDKANINSLATLPPTPSPTRFPTPSPTPSPTSPPTMPPTSPPTLIPTPDPTPRTFAPTVFSSATQPPASLPTPLPTPNPTPDPTPVPTVAPVPQPARAPTRLPTRVPTSVPTLPPSTTAAPQPTSCVTFNSTVITGSVPDRDWDLVLGDNYRVLSPPFVHDLANRIYSWDTCLSDGCIRYFYVVDNTTEPDVESFEVIYDGEVQLSSDDIPSFQDSEDNTIFVSQFGPDCPRALGSTGVPSTATFEMFTGSNTSEVFIFIFGGTVGGDLNTASTKLGAVSDSFSPAGRYTWDGEIVGCALVAVFDNTGGDGIQSLRVAYENDVITKDDLLLTRDGGIGGVFQLGSECEPIEV